MRCANIVEVHRKDTTFFTVCKFEAQVGKRFCKSCEAKLSVPDKKRPERARGMAVGR